MLVAQPSPTVWPRVLLYAMDPRCAAWLAHCLSHTAETILLPDGDLSALGRIPGARAIITGHRCDDPALGTLLEYVGAGMPVFVIGQRGASQVPTDPRIFFVLSALLPPADITALVDSALRGRSSPEPELLSPEAAEHLTRVLALATAFASRSDLPSAAASAEHAAQRLTGADRTYCLFHDIDSGALWAEGATDREGQATVGLAGFVARTGRACVTECARVDPRYVQALDDPLGDGNERLLAYPVVGPGGRVHAVLVAVRSPARPMFSLGEQQLLATFAESTGPMMHHLARMVEAQGVLRLERERRSDMYRPEALTAYGQVGHRGDVIRVSPGWIRWAFWALLGLIAGSVAYLFLGRVHRYSVGPAIVRLHKRTEVTARSGGALRSVEVAPGEHVEQNQLLAHLDDRQARARIDQLQREFDDQLRAHLLDPSDVAAKQRVFALRGELASAHTRLEQHQLRASEAGVVSDIRIRPGQHIVEGDIVLSLLAADDDRHVKVFVRGADSPQLAPGMPLRLEIAGYQYAYQDLTIDAVSDEVIGPAEARRYLGPQVADNLRIDGPVVLVRARLPESYFEANHEVYRFHDGMLATARIAVRTEPIISTLLPFLHRVRP